MKALKFILSGLGVLSLPIVLFYFWGSSSHIDQGDYEKVITYADPSPEKDTLRVMTFNLGYLSGMKNNLPVEMPEETFEENLKSSRSFLNKIAPDIIGFQEIDYGSDRSWNRNQLDSLSEGFHQAYASVNWDKNYVPFPYWPIKYHFGKMNSGQTILSKYPILNAETMVLDKPLNTPFYYNRFYLNRLIQLSDVRVGDRVVKIMNLHLENIEAETREQQALLVKEQFEKYASDMPVLLIGDFNAKPYWIDTTDQTIQTILSAGNIDSAIPLEEGDLRTNMSFSSSEPDQMIDYVFYNPSHIHMISAKVHQEAGQVSDHFPVSMTFTFTSENDSLISE